MRAVKFMFAVALMFATIFSANFCSAEKITVGVMPLENMLELSDSAKDEQTVAEIMRDQLIVAIQESGNYIVVERSQLQTLLTETETIGMFTDSNSDYSIELNKLYGAQYIVVGKITMVKTEAANKSGFFNKIKSAFDAPYRTKITLDLRFVESQTGRVVLAKTIESNRGGKDAKTSLYNACREAANIFMKQVQETNPLTAKIIGVEGDVIYINANVDSGLHKDEILIVAREGTPLEDEYGIQVGMTHIDIGKAKVISVGADYSTCRVTENTTSIQKGDVVRRGN